MNTLEYRPQPNGDVAIVRRTGPTLRKPIEVLAAYDVAALGQWTAIVEAIEVSATDLFDVHVGVMDVVGRVADEHRAPCATLHHFSASALAAVDRIERETGQDIRSYLDHV